MKAKPPKVMQGTWAKHLYPSTVARQQNQRSEIPSDRIISTTKLANGATYTRLKPAYADGTESAEDWTRFNL